MKLFRKIFNKKFIGIFLVIVILFNVISPNILTPKSYAIDVAGILLWPLTFLVSTLADAALAIVSLINPGGSKVFIDSIVYNKLPVFYVNIFDTGKMSEAGVALNSGTAGSTMLNTIQKWYFITRTMAIAASLIILVYVAIKILISTAAGDKAKYKSLLKDWAVSLLLIFTMHYIMAAILFITDALTDMIASLAGFPPGSAATDSAVYDYISQKAVSAEWDSIIYGVMQWVLVIITLAFIIIYAKRVVMIAFLTVFAPLIALSYSVDKIKDGQSQILDKWMKEYIYNALMMPLDAILFTILSDAIMTNLGGGSGSNLMFGIALIIGYLPLRGWFNEFLGTDKAKHGMQGLAAGAMIGNAISNMSKTKDKSSKTKEQVTSNEEKTSIEGGEKNHDIATKASPNPLLNGGADKAKVSSPTSGAASVASSNSSAELTAGQQAVQDRQARRERAGNALANAGRFAAGAYGKGLGAAAALTAGAITMATTGKASNALGVGIGIAKTANRGNEYGLGGKLVEGTAKKVNSVGNGVKSAVIGGKDVATGIAATASQMRDRHAVSGMVGAMAAQGMLSDIDDDDERAEALQWSLENTSQERFEELYDQVQAGGITEDEMDDIMFREAIQANKKEITQNYADKRLEERTNTNAEIEAAAAKSGKEARIDAKKNGVTNNEEELKAIESDTRKSAAKRMKSEAKEARKQESEAISAKKKEIKRRGKK